jgi:hypothetical protein
VRDEWRLSVPGFKAQYLKASLQILWSDLTEGLASSTPILTPLLTSQG